MKLTPLLTLTHTKIQCVTFAHDRNRVKAGRTEDICPLQVEMPLDKHTHTHARMLTLGKVYITVQWILAQQL